MRTAEGVPYLSQANFVGQGFNIYETHDIDSVTIPLFDLSKAGTTEFYFLGNQYALPDYIIGAEQTEAFIQADSVSSREEFQNSISANASVKGSYGAFSGQMSASYGKQFSKNSQYNYAYRNEYFQLALLTLKPSDKYLTDEFQDRVDKLPKILDKSNLTEFADFFDDFGAYFVSRVTLGATLQYYAAVSTTSQTTTEEISASVEAEYKGLFYSAGVSASVKSSSSWKSYYSNRSVNILGQGGDVTKLAGLVNVDANDSTDNDAAQKTTDAFSEWTESIKMDPAVVNFQLSGIWELTGSKSEVVEQAFTEYGRNLRPRMTIENSANRAFPEDPVLPVIILNGDEIKPKNDPGERVFGYQMVILDRTNLSQSGVLHNKYYTTSNKPNWNVNYPEMYEKMLNDINKGGWNNSDNILILVSFEMFTNAPPTADFYELLLTAGAGEEVRTWLNGARAGSSANLDKTVYTFVGIFKSGTDTAIELFKGFNVNTVEAEQEVLFYSTPGSQLYSFGAGLSKTS
ncbi:MAG: hypothetical protein F6K41_25200 [Symploca sp. SIO3E6]|nr:hypothetical protein [Caldora sp. SIO3E6]